MSFLGRDDDWYTYTLYKVLPNGKRWRVCSDPTIDEARMLIDDESDYVIVEERNFKGHFGWQSEETDVEYYENGIEVFDPSEAV